MSKDFASLHTHTSYSKLDGMSKIPTFLDRVVELGMSSAGISDHGNMSGVIEFYREAKKRGVRPVLGQETYFTDDRLSRTGVAQHDKNGEIDGSSKLYYHLSTYAQDNEGYHNLIKLSSDAFINGYYRKPRADYETLELYGKGLIVGSGCLGGPVLQPLLHGNYDAALATAAKLQDIVGKENFFIELMRHGLPEEAKTNPSLISIAKQIGAPIYATQDTHYTHAHEHEHHDVLLCCNTGSQLDTPGRFRFASDQYYLKSPDEMYNLFSDYPEACTNTLVIAERCNVNFEFDTLHLPQFNVPEGFEDDNAYLRHLVMEKLTSRYPEPTDVVYERLNYELSVIESMGVSSYMLITWDVIEFLRREGMFTSPGRGSSAASIICYILGITKVDPIKYGLIFERFLNPSRIALPDIDIDIEQGYRERAINYTVEKYGRENVAQIITFGTIKARKAVQDASRVLGYEPWVGARINKMMPPLISGFDTPLAACLEKQDKYADGYEAAADLRQEYAINPDAKLIIDTALGIEGAQRNIGVHAAAVVIGDRRLDDLVPLAVSDNGVVITQFEKNTIEDLGLLKMDFLGLKNLDILGYCERLIGNGFSLDDVPKDDANTYRMLSRGESIGCFQIESSGMRALLKELRPDNLNDISAVLALYRPGPMAQDWHTAYARRKNGSENALPFHYDAMDVLKETYFLAPYQEQVMALSQRFAGYNMTEADNLRKIMGKKLPEKMAAEREKFVKGCVDQGYDEELGTEVFNMIEGFSAYGFNKCLTGDTTVERASGNQYSPRTVSIVELYEKLQDRKSSWSQKFRDPKRGLKILALDDDGRIRPQRVKDVVFNGNKPVWRITLIDGKTITSTANHRHMTTVGWKETSEIGVGEELLVNDGLDGNRKRKWEVGYSVSSSEVVSIEYVGVQPTYDLEMDFSGHNFVANGIVTHNSHSMSYGFVTYWTAYLKANYPKEYMASLCTFAMDDLDKTALYLGEARRMGLKVYPPDVLKSELGCTVEEDGIRIGLGTLKGIGAGAAQEIIDIRKREGFSNIHDFARKVNPKAPALSALALSGALDAWGPRMGIAHVAKDLMAQVRKDAKKAAKSESLFDIFEYSEFEIPNIEFGWHEKLEKEKEVLGIYASGHPLEDYVEYVTSTSISDLRETQERTVREFVAIITKLEIKNTKSGNKMAFIDVEDLTGAVQVIAFQKTLNEFSHLLEVGSVVRLTTKTGYDSYRDDNSYHLMSVEPISIKTSSTPGQPESRVTPFGIHVPRGFFQDDMKVLRLKSILNKYNGETPVEVYVSRTVKRDIGFDLGVNVCDNMIMEIKELFNVN